jgi:hypothetical protein
MLCTTFRCPQSLRKEIDMSITQEDIVRAEREESDRERLAEQAKAAEDAKMEEWTETCKTPLKVNARYMSPRGEIYKLTHIIEKPNPKVYGSGKYRIQYLRDAEASDDDVGLPALPLGVFEMMGGPR